MIKVLICEDLELIRKCFVALLGYEAEIKIVGEAADGQEALEQVDALRPDVVLMDLRMPVMDGLAATTQIARNYPGTRVIMLSSYNEREEVQKCMEAGAAAYVLKVAGTNELVAVIKQVYDGGRLRETIGIPRPYPDLPYAHQHA